MTRYPKRRALTAAVVGALALVAVASFVGLGYASSSSSAATAAAQEYAPASTSAPTVTGTAAQGQVLTAHQGTWASSTSPSFTYAWQRCDAGGGSCGAISGATGATYTATSADVGHALRVTVTAANPTGSASATSGPTAAVAAPGAGGSGTTIAASAVTLPDRLVVDQVKFSPNPVRSRASTVTARFHVSDTSGRSVGGALVYMIGIPYNRIPKVPEQPTAQDGWATFQFRPTAKFPIVNGGALVVFVRARTPQGDPLVGSSTRRLVQLNVTTP